MNGIDKFAFNPSGIVLFDGCHGAALSTKWGTKTEVGTLITIGAGYIKFAHAGAAAAGLSILPFGRNFGVQTTFEADVQVVTGAGEVSINSGLRIYANADNWVQVGPRISGAANNAVAITWQSDGTAGSNLIFSGPVDDIVRRLQITVLENHILVYVNGNLAQDIEFNDPARDIVDYVFQLIAGTTDTTDILDIRYSNIKISNIVTEPKWYPNRFKGVLSLADTTPVELTFLGAECGETYELTFAANLGTGYMPYAFTLDGPATFLDVADECNTLDTASVVILPAVPVAGDGIYFGADEKFRCIDVYMDGGVSNTDNDFIFKYWDGSAWSALAPTDGTNGGVTKRTFHENGRIVFAPPVDWATTAVNGVTAYWVFVEIETAGASVPMGTHIQLGFNASSDFDHAAAFLSTLMVKMKRNFPTSGYSRAYSDGMPYAQCIGERNPDINGWRCDGNIKLSFELSETPDKTVLIEYFGFTRRI